MVFFWRIDGPRLRIWRCGFNHTFHEPSENNHSLQEGEYMDGCESRGCRVSWCDVQRGSCSVLYARVFVKGQGGFTSAQTFPYLCI